MIALSQFAIVMFVAGYSFRLAVSLFIFLLAFSPRSLGVPIGSENFSLTFARITLPIILALYFITRAKIKATVDSSKIPISKIGVFHIILSISFVKMVATLINGAFFLYAVEDMVFSTFVFASFYTFATQRLLHAVMLSIALAMLVTCLIAFVEMGLQQPIYTSFADMRILNTRTAEGLFRDGAYRVQAFFDNPLSLSEFAAYSLPVAMSGAATMRGIPRIICYASVPAIVTIVVLTGSRSGILVSLIAGLTFISAIYWSKFSRASRVLLTFIMLVLFCFILFTSAQFVTVLIAEGQGARFDLLMDSERSNISRALQFQQVFEALSVKPFLGFGVLQNYSRELEEIHTLDNYYLRLGLEAGYLGMGLFVLFLFASFKHCNRNRSSYPVQIYAMTTSLIATFACYKLFLSIPTNNLYFYALLGLSFGFAAQKRSPFSCQHRSASHPPLMLHERHEADRAAPMLGVAPEHEDSHPVSGKGRYLGAAGRVPKHRY